MISKLPKNIYVHYAGEYKPEQMQHIVSQSDAMVLLSKGENFSHAIYESLSAGRPVISSHYTSWDNLTSKYAGWNFAINEPKLLAMELDDLASYAENEWNKFAKGAYQLANDYISNQTFVDDYLNLFYT
jgi:glycosyltransferase involved in cell wall biosynthesis